MRKSPVDFLVVGAMKAGTTTLYRDLLPHPEISIPEQKEPNTLVRFSSQDEILSDYAQLFEKSRKETIRGEFSTAYTKRPVNEGVADRAYEMSEGHLRIVYLRRDPLTRIISHYKHEFQLGRIKTPISQALREVPELIEFTRYDWQIAPWKDRFGDDRVLELDLEDYSADRAGVARMVVAHVGADPAKLPSPDVQLIANHADEMKRIDNKLLDQLIRSSLYQRTIKPAMPRAWREKGRRTILPRPQAPPIDISLDDMEYIGEALAPYNALK